MLNADPAQTRSGRDVLPLIDVSSHHDVVLGPSNLLVETLIPGTDTIYGVSATAMQKNRDLLPPESLAAARLHKDTVFAVADGEGRKDGSKAAAAATDGFLKAIADEPGTFDTVDDARRHVADAFDAAAEAATKTGGAAELTAGRIVKLPDGSLHAVLVQSGHNVILIEDPKGGVLRLAQTQAVVGVGGHGEMVMDFPLTKDSRIIIASGAANNLTDEEREALFSLDDAAKTTNVLVRTMADKEKSSDSAAVVIDIDPDAAVPTPNVQTTTSGSVSNVVAVPIALPNRPDRRGERRAASTLARLKMYEADGLTKDDVAQVAKILGLKDFSELRADTDISVLKAFHQAGDILKTRFNNVTDPSIDIPAGIRSFLNEQRQLAKDKANATATKPFTKDEDLRVGGLGELKDSQLEAMADLIAQSINTKRVGMDSKAVKKVEELLGIYVRAANHEIRDKWRDRVTTPGAYIGAVLLSRVTGSPAIQASGRGSRKIKGRGATAREVAIGNIPFAVAAVGLLSAGFKTYLSMRHGVDVHTGGASMHDALTSATTGSGHGGGNVLPTTHPTPTGSGDALPVPATTTSSPSATIEGHDSRVPGGFVGSSPTSAPTSSVEHGYPGARTTPSASVVTETASPSSSPSLNDLDRNATHTLDGSSAAPTNDMDRNATGTLNDVPTTHTARDGYPGLRTDTTPTGYSYTHDSHQSLNTSSASVDTSSTRDSHQSLGASSTPDIDRNAGTPTTAPSNESHPNATTTPTASPSNETHPNATPTSSPSSTEADRGAMPSTTATPTGTETAHPTASATATGHPTASPSATTSPEHAHPTTTSTPKPSNSATHTPAPSTTHPAGGVEHPAHTATGGNTASAHGNTPAAQDVYHVKRGDTLTEIAQKALQQDHVRTSGANTQKVIDEIMRENHLHSDRIYADQTVLKMDGAHKLVDQMHQHAPQPKPAAHLTAAEVTQRTQATMDKFSDTSKISAEIHKTPIEKGEGVLHYLKRLGIDDPVLRTKLDTILNNDSHLKELRTGLTTGKDHIMYVQEGTTELRFSRPGEISQQAADHVAQVIAKAVHDHQQELIDAVQKEFDLAA